ncbi:Lipoprotein releasing system transmembrane protein LolC/LolE [hydrothermal vent metagenome]|uniref:Lipoprotein releasing system transmembrane protein LolC/LolE n=1 Tax=hydrothermal vent metagenome TaxID=652676 RepID=A0A3B1CQZ4_9ZZZZ
MFEFFIAKKYLGTKHKLNFITIISIISTLGITIGVAALVIVISVFNGFGSFARSLLLNFDPHLRIVSTSENSEENIDTLKNILSNTPEVKSFYPYVEGKIVLLNKNSYQFINVKGIKRRKENDNNWGVTSSIYTGKLDFNERNNIPSIALSLKTSLKLRCRIGDTITATSLKSIEKMLTNFLVLPSSKRFVVSGIYQSNNKDYDAGYSFTSLKAAQELLDIRNISGYEVRLNDIDDSELVKKELESQLNHKYFSVYTWYDMHKDFYDVMQIERWAAFILLLLIISVATFNILGSLTMSVIEKRRDIGILRSMGAKKKSILRIFMFEGVLIGSIGTVLGLILGLLVCYLQIEFKLYPLDPMKYRIDAIPVQLQIADLIIIPIVSMFLSFLASLYPAKRAVKLNVIDSIKYE